MVDANKKVVDRYTTPFGIRTIEFDPAQGFLLNGRHVKIQGVCDHHDLGALGAAVNRRATERQMEILKKRGRERHPHQPQSAVAGTAGALRPHGHGGDGRIVRHVAEAQGAQRLLPSTSTNGASAMCATWCRRDRNHPSVIMWSIGNEIPGAGQPRGRRDGQAADRISSTRRTPPVPPPPRSTTRRAPSRIDLGDNVDLLRRQLPPVAVRDRSRRSIPTWIIFGSETASCVSSRGVYHLPIEKYEKHPSLQLTSYDIIAPPWAYCPDVEFFYQDKLPNVLGEFVWTGFDYIGEPTPYFGGGRGADNSADWPARSSYFGFIDLAGLPQGPLLPLPEPVDARRPWCTCCRTGTGRARKGRPFR